MFLEMVLLLGLDLRLLKGTLSSVSEPDVLSGGGDDLRIAR